jgi:hypothetical protein
MLKRSLEVDKEKFVFSMVLECCVEIELLKTGVARDSFWLGTADAPKRSRISNVL